MHLKLRIIDDEFPLAYINDTDAQILGMSKINQLNLTNLKTKETRSILTIRSNEKISPGEIVVPQTITSAIHLSADEPVEVTISPPASSLAFIQKKIDGEKLTRPEFSAIISDIIENKLSPMEITSFLVAVSTTEMDIDELESFAREMVAKGDSLTFERKPVVDCNSIGWVPGNKNSLIIVPILAASGLTVPHISPRAIIDATGTANIMEALCPIEYKAESVREMIRKTGAVIVEGESTNLAPVDDLLILLENHLHINHENKMIPGIIAKKKAAGVDICVIEIAVGFGDKMLHPDDGKKLAQKFIELGRRLDIHVCCLLTNGDEPVGRTIGVNLSAREVLEVLENKESDEANLPLVNVNCALAGLALEASGKASHGKGAQTALNLIKSGKALAMMKEIIAIQGGNPDISSEDLKPGQFSHVVHSPDNGKISEIDNTSLIKIAQVLGVPNERGAGIYFHKKIGDTVSKDEPLYTLYAENENNLELAREIARTVRPITIKKMVIDYVIE